ncbi:MAG: hypothetical protein ACOYL7_03060 [Caldilinea sp.]|jgi:hypothetical protein
MLAYATTWMIGLVVTHAAVATLLGWQVYQRGQGWARWLGFGILYPWLGLTVLLTTQGWVADMTEPISPLGIVMTIATGGGLALMLLWPPLKQAVESLPLSWLMGVQVYRVFGIVFLFGWLAGEVPLALGPLTAFNDVAVGLSALVVTAYVLRGGAVWVGRVWNVYGLLDFAYAVPVGVLAAPHALRLLNLTPDTSALGVLPLSFITLWAVPLSIMLHVAALRKLGSVVKVRNLG